MKKPPIPEDLPRLPARAATSHKGDHGRILLIAGSHGMHGAAALAASAAFRSGAGLVTIALPMSIYPLVGALEPRATYLPLPDEGGGIGSASWLVLERVAARADVIAIGPGLGQRAPTTELLRRLVPAIRQPLVLDADGLNAFGGEPAAIAGSASPRILTPHPGELARLTGQEPGDDPERRRTAAIDLAMRSASCVILKGHRSVVTDGMETHENETGNPGMATAGAGDVLTGCLAAVFAVLRDARASARLGAFVHGLAGDLATAALGETSVTATDLADFLPAAWRTLSP
jgi:NAD(P)H-hydrate epimerase